MRAREIDQGMLFAIDTIYFQRRSYETAQLTFEVPLDSGRATCGIKPLCFGEAGNVVGWIK